VKEVANQGDLIAQGTNTDPVTLSPCHLVALSPCHTETPSPLRAWLYLVWLCIQRQARARLMIWIALALLAIMTTWVGLVTLGDRWGMRHWRSGRTGGYSFQNFQQLLETLPLPLPATPVQNAFTGVNQALLAQSGFYVFAHWGIFLVFIGFILPLWSLSFATDALGGERESRTLLWLLNQPLPRPFIYLAKFVAVLPFSLGLNLGGREQLIEEGHVVQRAPKTKITGDAWCGAPDGLLMALRFQQRRRPTRRMFDLHQPHFS